MSRYRKKKSFPLSMLVLLVVLALLFALPACTSFFTATGGGNTPSGGNPPSGGVVTPPSEEEPDGSGGTVDEPQVDDNGNCLHATTILTAQYMTQNSCLPTVKCARCGEVIQSLPETPHNFENGVCTMCKHVCEHPGVAENDPCPYCGLGCIHAETSYHSCYTTGYATHTEYHVCADCGYKKGVSAACSFENSNTCKLCNFICTHEKTTVTHESGNNTQHFERASCSTCGWDMGSKLLEHTFEAGTCTVCRHVCPHEYKGGLCGYCGLKECTHALTYGYSNTGGSYYYTQACECGQMNKSGTNVSFSKQTIAPDHEGYGSFSMHLTYYGGMKWSDAAANDCAQPGTLRKLPGVSDFVAFDAAWGTSYYVEIDGYLVEWNDYIPITGTLSLRVLPT